MIWRNRGSRQDRCDRKRTKPKECIRSEIISRTCAIFYQVPAELRRGSRTTKNPHQKGSWGEDQEEAFRELKTLAYSKNDCKTRVIADAGPTGLRAVLTQLQEGQWRVVAHASKNLTAVERIPDRERGVGTRVGVRKISSVCVWA